MSATDGDGPDESRPRREVAYRLFAAEFDDATVSYSESDEERAPNYVVTPTGARVNRLFAVGVLTEVESVNEDVLRGRLVDPTGAFVTYAGQYQPDEMAFLDRASPPAFVALSGKARTFQPDDSDRVFTSVRPESASRVDADTRDRWTVVTARATLHRVGVAAAALRSGRSGEALGEALRDAGVDESLAAGVPLALDRYGTTPAYLAAVRRLAVDALEVVAGDREEVRSLDRDPGDAGDGAVDLDALAADLDLAAPDDAGPEESDPTRADAETTAPETPDAGTGVDDADADAVPTFEGSTADPDDAGTVDDASEAVADAAEDASGATPGAAEQSGGASTPDDPGDFDAGAGTTADAETASDAAAADGAEAADDVETVDTETAGDTATASDAEAAGDAGTVDTETAGGAEAAGDAGTTGDAAGTTGADELGDFDAADDDGMYELDDEERAEIESEYGTEFSTGSEVAPAGEADIDVPSVDELEEELDEDLGAGDAAEAPPSDAEAADTETADAEADGTADAETTAADADDAAEAETTDDAGDPAADVDLEAAAVDAMAALDDGDGAAREAVVARVVDEHGADPGAVEDAIQSALMSGQCYEPTEDSLKAI